MALHWTDFPERIESFGELFSILESLSHDVRHRRIFMGMHGKETQRSAYKVEHTPGTSYLQPRPERMPGWDRIATFAERNHLPELSYELLRLIRGRVSEVLDLPSTDVNQLTLEQVADALEASDRDPDSEPAADTTDEYRWLRVRQVARVFALNPGQVSNLADDGTFVTNGMTGYDRRIDVVSVVQWVLERLNRQEAAGPAVEEG